jgi:hypothetical protein
MWKNAFLGFGLLAAACHAPQVAVANCTSSADCAEGLICDGSQTCVSCAQGWQPLLEFGEGSPPPALAAAEGAVIFEVTDEDERTLDIKAFNSNPTAAWLSSHGGRQFTIVHDDYADLWVEGDTLFYSPLGAGGCDQLFSVPLGGGGPTLVADGNRPAALLHCVHPEPLLLDASYFYWLEEDVSEMEQVLWRVPRQGGEAMKVGGAPLAEFDGPEVAFSSDGVVFADSTGNAVAVPFDARAGTRPLAQATTADSLLGVDADGAYWTNPDTNAMFRSPADGGPIQPFWPAKSASLYPTHLWADGQGGWVVTVTRQTGEPTPNNEVWRVDEDGNGALVACDPAGSTGLLSATRPAFADDATYLATSLTSTSWALIKVPR